MKRWIALMGPLVVLLSSKAMLFSLLAAEEEPAAERAQKAAYILEKADEARDAGKLTEAVILYRDAISRYTKLAEKHPDWEPDVVRLRLVYCDEQLSALLAKKKTVDTATISDGPKPFAGPRHLSPVALPNGAAASQEASQIVGRVKPLIIAGKKAEARAMLLEHLQNNPDDVALRYLIGVVQCQDGNYHDAAYVLETLAEEHPEHALTHVALGVAYLGLGRKSDAEREMKSALKLHPHLPEAFYNLARISLLMTPADVEAARRYYRSALEYGALPDAELEHALGFSASQGEREAAHPSSPPLPDPQTVEKPETQD